jgi:hypothetical protein
MGTERMKAYLEEHRQTLVLELVCGEFAETRAENQYS